MSNQVGRKKKGYVMPHSISSREDDAKSDHETGRAAVVKRAAARAQRTGMRKIAGR